MKKATTMLTNTEARELLSAVPLTGVIANEIAQIHIPKGEYQQHEMRLSIYAPPIGIDDVFVSIDEVAVVFHHVIEQCYAKSSHPRRLKLTAIKRLLHTKVAKQSVRLLYLECDLIPLVVVPLKYLATALLRRRWTDDWVCDFLLHVSDAVQYNDCITLKPEYVVTSISGLNALDLLCVYEQDMILAIGLVILGKYPSYTDMTYEHSDFLLWCDQIKQTILSIEAETSLPIYDGFPIKQDNYSSIYAHPNVIMHWLGSQLGETHPWISFQLQKAGFNDLKSWLEALLNPAYYMANYTNPMPFQGLGSEVVRYNYPEKNTFPRYILMIGWNVEVVKRYWKASICSVKTDLNRHSLINPNDKQLGLTDVTFVEPFMAFDQRKKLLAQCELLINCHPADSLNQNLMDFAIQEGIEVITVHKTPETYTKRHTYTQST